MKAPSTTASDFDSCRAGSASLRATISSAAPRYAPLPVCVLAVAILTLVLFGVAVQPAGAAQHLTVTGEYGKQGPKGTGVGSGCDVAYQSATHRLYVFTDGLIYALDRTGPGSVTPISGNFPLQTGIGTSSCYEADLAVDNSAGATDGNFYAESYFAENRGWDPTGATLSGWPIPNTGQNCGVAVTGAGQIWMGHYGGGNITKFNPDGSSAGSIPLGFNPCRIAVDQTNGDVYVHPNGGDSTYRLTAASGYTDQTAISTQGGAYPQLAVNGERHLLYVANGSEFVKSYDTDTGALKETIEVGAPAYGIAIDEETDTLFILAGSGSSGRIKEYLGVRLPKATTGEVLSDAEVSGTADPAGLGPITECYFQFGTSVPGYGSTVPCEESTPIASAQTVHAVLPGLTRELTYHYRLVVANATPESTGVGLDRTIIQHNVTDIRTEDATEVTRTSVTANGSFQGTGDPHTYYYFEWGLGASGPYEHQSATPPGPDLGVTNGPKHVSGTLSGLVAETTYHYRVVASNSLGVSQGEAKVFTTDPAIKALSTSTATEIATETATLNGTIDPDGFATTFYFEYGKSTDYGLTAPVPPGISVGTTAAGDTPVSAPVTDLEPGKTYHFRVVGVNEFGRTVAANDQSFTAAQPPSIESFTSRNVSADSAELVGRINPNNEATTWFFEYGLSPEYGSVIPVEPGALGPGSTTETVVEPLTNLTKGTYHFRLTAKSKWGTTVSGDQTFSFYPLDCPNAHLRQQTGAGYLPDCRAYELVSPGEVNSTVLFPQGPTSPYATNPSRFAFTGVGAVINDTGEGQGVFGDLYVSTRTVNGWTTRYVGIPGNEGTITAGPPGPTPPSPAGVYADLGMNRFLDWDRGQFGYVCCGLLGSFSPFMWNAHGDFIERLPTNIASIPNGTADITNGGFEGDVKPSPDFSHYFFSSRNVSFATGGLTTAPGSAYDNNLDTGEVTLISKTAQGGDIPSDAGGPGEAIKFPGVSRDGSHILMSTEAPGGLTHLYMTVDDVHHYDVTRGTDGLNHGGTFEGMTSDGRLVYFTSPDRLSADDTDTSVDLYMWNEETPDSVTLVSQGTGGSGNSDDCGGATWIAKCGAEVVDINPPDQYGQTRSQPTDNAIAAESGVIYFYSPELLDNGKGTVGNRNFYEYRDGRPNYVFTLAPNHPVRRIQVSPDGAHAAFVTAERLTSYDNAGYLMMYSYEPETRRLLCVSCAPDGAPPRYDIEASRNGLFMSDDGRTFFGSKDSLVNIDTNGLWDTYEFVDNRPQLISSGTFNEDQGFEFNVGLLGVSADGVDVYFSTLETLVPTDANGPFYKFYDARTGGGFGASTEQAPCAAADECHGPTSVGPPSQPKGTSTSLGSGGNHKTQKPKKKKKKHGHRKHRRTPKHGGSAGGGR